MKREIDWHGYSFPNAVVMYWLYISPMIVIFLLFLIINHKDIFMLPISNDVILNFVCLVTLSLIIMPLIAYIFANSYPEIRLRIDGLEIQIYSPFKRRVLFVAWKDIEEVDIFKSPALKILNPNRKWIFIRTRKLPYFYHILSLIYKRSFYRGFIITHRINQFDKLLKVIIENTRNKKQS
jgi:hypothetical protein